MRKRKSYLEFKANSVADYLSICTRILQEWSNTDMGEPKLWFRGQKKTNWSLNPGEYRYPLIDSDEMRSEFILRAKTLLKKDPDSVWEWYFLMQHYGLPTRLLDWTEGSLIGLHFAISEDTGQDDAAVWVLDPWVLNKWSICKAELVITGKEFPSDPIAEKYLKPVYIKQELPDRPIAIVPPYNSQRITVQRGTFTIHGNNTNGLEEQFKEKIVKIIIPRSKSLEMRRELRCVGISEFTIFPDLDGLCRDIRSSEIEGC